MLKLAGISADGTADVKILGRHQGFFGFRSLEAGWSSFFA
jgi:hypothetical protein